MLDAFALSDKGCVRSNNEDYCLIEPELGLYVLADGMGGANAGERASRLAVDTVAEAVLMAQRRDSQVLLSAVEEANRRVLDAAQHDVGFDRDDRRSLPRRFREHRQAGQWRTAAQSDVSDIPALEIVLLQSLGQRAASQRNRRRRRLKIVIEDTNMPAFAVDQRKNGDVVENVRHDGADRQRHGESGAELAKPHGLCRVHRRGPRTENR